MTKWEWLRLMMWTYLIWLAGFVLVFIAWRTRWTDAW